MIQLQRYRKLVGQIGLIRGAIALILLVSALMIARYSWMLPLAVDAERQMYDSRLMLTAPRVNQDKRITMIVYNDDTLEATGRRLPLDRGLLARALMRIDALEPKAIGIDILIDQPQPEDPQLVAALRSLHTPTYLAFTTNATNQASMLYWQERFERAFEQRLAGRNVKPASILLQADADGVVRSWPMRVEGLPPLLADQMVPSMRAPDSFSRSILFRVPRTRERGLIETIPIQLFDDGASAEMLRQQVTGRLILIGGDITETDQFDTPLTRLTGQTTTGLAIHAAMIAQKLDGRSPPPLSKTMLWLFAVLVTALGIAAGGVELRGWRFAVALALPLIVILSLPLAMQAAGVDTQDIPAFGWVIGWTLAYSAAAATARGLGSEQRRFAQNALGRYLPRDVARAILRDPDQLSLHGERRTILALFSDLEGFTKLTHAIAPEMVALLLNRYLDMLSNVVLAHGGTIDKFVGDAVVAFWGAPIARDDDGDRALAATIAMVEVGEQFRATAPEGVPPIGRTRVGLHRGEAIVGNFGGEGRIQYTALGDAMNAAARLESANKALGTRALISAEAAAVMRNPPLRPMGRVAVRGRSTPIAVFEPAAEFAQDDIAELSAVLSSFDAGDPTALAALARLAARYPDDAALACLGNHLTTAGPGGFYALD